MKKIIIILLSTLLLVTGCQKKALNEGETNKFKQEYESLNDKTNDNGKTYVNVEIPNNNLMVYATIKDLENIFENRKSGVIYFGYPECPWCRNAVPNLIKGIKRTTLDKIYYMNVHDIRSTWIYQDGKAVMTSKGTDDYYKILNWLDAILDIYEVKDSEGNTYNTNEKRLYVPTVVFVKEGKIVGYHMDTVESQTDPYVPLTNSEQKELQGIYETLAHNILDDTCDESC